MNKSKIKIKNLNGLKKYLIENIPVIFNATFNGKKIKFLNGEVFEIVLENTIAKNNCMVVK